MSALAEEFPEVDNRELLARATWVLNTRECYKGYSPMQHALGKSPDECDRMFEAQEAISIRPELLQDGGFQEDAKIRICAEKAFLDEQAKRRLERAERMGKRRDQLFLPGDLVFYWRTQIPHNERGTFQTGKFLGPARVLATETRRDNGELRKGSIVWLY